MKIFGAFDHDVILTLVPVVSALWSLGGSGQRLLRRLGVPAAIALYAYGYGITLWPLTILLASTLGLIGFGPGYGDSFYAKLKSFYWPYIFILGALYGACQFGLAVHFGGWMVLVFASGFCSLVFGGSMLLSKKFGLPWKVAEMLTGASVGLTAVLIMR